MKSSAYTATGFYTTYTFSTNSSYQYSSAAIRRNVTASAMVVGDHHSPNPHSYTITNERCFKGRIDYYWPKSKIYSTSEGFFGGSSDRPVAPPWNRTLVYNRALEKLNSKVRGDLDLGVSLAEIHSTTRMISALRPIFSRSILGSISGIGGTKDLAKGWLQYTYGWKPLMSDVFGIADESVRVVLNRIEKVRAGARLPITVGDRSPRTVHSKPVSVVRSGSGFEACHFNLELEVPDFDMSRWTSLNPASLAWELIPYSFVIDWFVDIGSYLRNLETALLFSTRFRSGYVSEIITYRGTETVPSGTEWSTSSDRYIFDTTMAKLHYVQFVRTKLGSYPFPRKPTFKVDLSSGRLLSAASLLRVLLR